MCRTSMSLSVSRFDDYDGELDNLDRMLTKPHMFDSFDNKTMTIKQNISTIIVQDAFLTHTCTTHAYAYDRKRQKNHCRI